VAHGQHRLRDPDFVSNVCTLAGCQLRPRRVRQAFRWMVGCYKQHFCGISTCVLLSATGILHACRCMHALESALLQGGLFVWVPPLTDPFGRGKRFGGSVDALWKTNHRRLQLTGITTFSRASIRALAGVDWLTSAPSTPRAQHHRSLRGGAQPS